MHDPTSKFDGTLSPKAERTAKLVSLIEQPPFLSIPAFIIICMLKSDDAVNGAISSLIAIIAASILPIFITFYFSRRFGNEDKLDVYRKEDRFMPLVCGIISYFLGVAGLYLVGAPQLATVLMLCYALVTLAITIITPYWKISIHSCGVMGPSLALTVGFWPYGLLYFLLLPPVIWSRYVLKKHTPLQLAMGAIVGLLITAVVFVILL